MGLFGGTGIRKKTQSGGGNYLSDGNYLLKVKMLKGKRSNKPPHNTLAIAEFQVVESDSAAFPIGSEGSWVANLTKHAAAAGDVNALVCSIYDLSTADVESMSDTEFEELCDDAFGEENPCEGKFVRARVKTVALASGNPFTKYAWIRADGSDPEEESETPAPVKKTARR